MSVGILLTNAHLAGTDNNLASGATLLLNAGSTFRSNTAVLLGTAGSVAGSVVFNNATSGSITINPPAGALGSITLTLPAASGTLLTTGGTITAANGGTGQTSYTVGDMLYASTTSALSKLAAVALGQVIISQGVGVAPVWSSTGRLGALNLYNNATIPGAPAAGTVLYMVQADASQNAIGGDASQAAGFNIVGRTCGGTMASPANTPASQIILFFGARGYGNGAYTTNVAQLQMIASSTWGNTDFSTQILLGVTATGATTPVTVFTLTGASLALTVALTTSLTTDSTSITTGSIIASGGLGVAKTIVALHYGGGGTAPTAAVGTGAGTSPSAVTVAGHDAAGSVSLTTGTLPTAAAVVLTLTFNTTYASAPFVNLQPANAATALLSGITMVYVTSTTTTFVITAGSTGLVAATAYSWNYSVHQ